MSGLEALTLTKLAKLIENKDVSPVEVTERMLDRIALCNQKMNVFISVTPEIALQQALEAESDILKGNYKGPLHGIPISIKDNIAVKGMRLTNGSSLYYNHISDKNAPIVEQIKRHGSIVIGKTSLDEFANNVTGVNQVYGTIKNAINPSYTAGGSSGGSAVSVANQLAYGSLGTDTSGSIRIPAACNGIVGLKPTTNLLPTTDIYPLSWTMDHVGLLSKDCDDLYHLYNGVTAKQYRHDIPQLSMNKLKVGMVDEKYLHPIHTEVKRAYDNVIKELIMNGIALEYIEMPKLDDMLEVLEIVIGFEASYIHQYNFINHKDKYDELNIEYLQEAVHISNQEYEQALSQVKKLWYRMQQIFEQVDFVIMPTLPMTVPMSSEKDIIWDNGLEGILEAMSRYTGLFNVSGLPALNITMGQDGNSMPIGLQAIGGYYQEKQLISFGKLMYEILDKKE